MRIIFKLLLLLGLFVSSLVAGIDECKTDLYYANGIMMPDSEEMALVKWRKKAYDLLLSKPESYKKIADIKISYNVSQGFLDDVLESFEQMMDNEWGWDVFTTYFTVYLTEHGIQEGWREHVNDLNNQVESYKKSIKDGHGVIVLAHSQGNYYTNEAYERLDDWMKEYFHMFGIATPANHVAGHPAGDNTSPYVKFHNDFIMLVVTGLPSNRDNPNSEHDEDFSVEAHDFYASYLTATNTTSEILGFIEQKIEEHTNAPSQWETDEEFDKDTEDYRITVKHRFDTSVNALIWEKVYPFAPSKKLYQAKYGELVKYIKASCGGDNITDSWEGQEPNEFWKIDNPQEEKIAIENNTIFAIATRHPSGSIYSSSNIVEVVKLKVEPATNSIVEQITLKTLGTFTNQPALYSMWYSTGLRPVNGYSVYWLYENTLYNGLSERYMYASNSLTELADKLIYSAKIASNFHGGNLNRDDNFWTNFLSTNSLRNVILELELQGNRQMESVTSYDSFLESESEDNNESYINN